MITLDYQSRTPIYEQIVNEIKQGFPNFRKPLLNILILFTIDCRHDIYLGLTVNFLIKPSSSTSRTVAIAIM